MLTALATFLSCDRDDYPVISDQEQKSPVFIYIEIDEKEYIDLESSYCLSRVYRISRSYIGPVRKALKLPIEECQKIIGRSPKEYGVYSEWFENFRNWLLIFN